MRKSLIVGLSVAALSITGLGAAYASGKYEHGPMMGERYMEEMAQTLKLDNSQQDKMDALHDENRKAMRDNMRSMRDLRTQLHALDTTAADYQQQVDALAKQIAAQTEQMVQMRANQHKAMSEILTPEQRQTLAQMREDRRDENRRGEYRRGEDDRGEYRHHEGEGKRCRD